MPLRVRTSTPAQCAAARTLTCTSHVTCRSCSPQTATQSDVRLLLAAACGMRLLTRFANKLEECLSGACLPYKQQKCTTSVLHDRSKCSSTTPEPELAFQPAENCSPLALQPLSVYLAGHPGTSIMIWGHQAGKAAAAPHCRVPGLKREALDTLNE